ncbi:hypothetical protein ACFQY4_01990 [Catellatospora bangladeshensis]|nr:hypothetical protein [Catellatospora bangladeshensis]
MSTRMLASGAVATTGRPHGAPLPHARRATDEAGGVQAPGVRSEERA